jgi:chromosome segregation ATPase
LALDEKCRFAHEDGNGSTQKVSVRLEIDNEKRIVPINTDRLILTREFDTNTGKDVYMLDDKIILKNDVYSLFGLSGISFNEICRTIHHGRISEIANLDEAGIMQLLFDYSGATQLKKRLENLKECLHL